MRKIIVIVLFIFVVYGLYFFKDDSFENINQELKGIFVSYIEYQKYFMNKDSIGIKEEIDKIVNNISNDGFNFVVLHVRPFSDSIYTSNVFPLSYTITGKEGDYIDFDILEYFIERFHGADIKVHAWINPYRIRNTTDLSSISVKNPAFKWIGTNNISVIDGKGIYYNPASSEVNDLIILGIKELISHYNVDAICFDDYFYPDDKIDLVNYNEYVSNGGKLDITNYRYSVINNMVKNVYDAIKEYDNNILFGISPDANIENNYNINFADVISWIDNNYVDYIMPQIYYGFFNQNKPFIDVVNEWNDYINNDVKLIPALAFYKIGEYDKYAFSGSNEWIDSSNIIKNQILVSRNMSNYQGFVLFRYDYYFENNKEQVLNEKNELCKIL